MSEFKLIAFNIIIMINEIKNLSKQTRQNHSLFPFAMWCTYLRNAAMPFYITISGRLGVWVILIQWRQRTQTLLFVHSKKINILRRNVVSWGLVGNGNPLIIWRLTLMRSLSVHYKVEVVVKSTPLEKHSTTNNSSYSNSCNTIF